MGLSIRQVGSDDLPAAVRLFELRDGRSYDAETICQTVCKFDPERILVWMAFDGVEPVGMTMMLIRELEVDGRRIKAGYWANLYIRPEYRQYLVYPRLVFAMTGALRKNDNRLLYTSVRLPEVAQAHVKLGFVKLGELTVRAKLLRPARLLMRYKGWPIGTPLAALPDLLYRGLLKLGSSKRNGSAGYELTPHLTLSQFASLLNVAQGKVRQVWSVKRIEERYAFNREGESYVLLGVRRHGKVVGAAVWRPAVRGNGVRAGVLMDLAFRTGEERAARSLLAAAEWSALGSGCDVMLRLDDHSDSSRIVDRTGYWSSPERYAVLLWPPQAARENAALADLRGWRYAFSDHDTF
jgi:Acetyltransferase (GNAT) domain